MDNKGFITKPSYIENPPKPPVTKKGYEELELIAGLTVERVVNMLLDCHRRGELVYAKVNGTILYSDTVTMDVAYLDITGKTKAEFDAYVEGRSLKRVMPGPKKLKVSQEVKDLLDKQQKDDWTKTFNLVSHCRAFSSNGVKMSKIYTDEFAALEKLSPLEYATCLIVGYEAEGEE